MAGGYWNRTEKSYSIALGVNATVDDDWSFVWSGKGRGGSTNDNYTSNGPKSFNINPDQGLSGFYIGTDNFLECIVKAIEGMSSNQKSRLRTALNA